MRFRSLAFAFGLALFLHLATPAEASPQPPRANAPFDPLATPVTAPRPPAKPAQAPAAKIALTTLTEADKAAAFRAAGFKRQGRDWKRCDDPGTASYSPGAIEAVTDLNGDGRPEVVITEGGTYCFGNTGTGFVILTKGATGAWTTVMDETGVYVPLKTRANGWLEVEAGGPGFSQPVYRFDGKAYVQNRTIKE